MSGGRSRGGKGINELGTGRKYIMMCSWGWHVLEKETLEASGKLD